MRRRIAARGRMRRRLVGAECAAVDERVEAARIAAEEVPIAMLAVCRRQSRRRRLHLVERGLIEIGKETFGENTLLPPREGEQRQHAQGGEGEEQAVP